MTEERITDDCPSGLRAGGGMIDTRTTVIRETLPPRSSSSSGLGLWLVLAVVVMAGVIAFILLDRATSVYAGESVGNAVEHGVSEVAN